MNVNKYLLKNNKLLLIYDIMTEELKGKHFQRLNFEWLLKQTDGANMQIIR